MTRRAAGITVGLLGLVAIASVLLLFGRDEVYSKEQKARVQMHFLEMALQEYASKDGRFPPENEGLGALVKSGQINPDGLKDPWDRPIGYRCRDQECDSVELTSADPSAGRSNSPLTLVVVKRR